MAGNSDLGHPNHKNIIELHNDTLIRKTKIKKKYYGKYEYLGA